MWSGTPPDLICIFRGAYRQGQDALLRPEPDCVETTSIKAINILIAETVCNASSPLNALFLECNALSVKYNALSADAKGSLTSLCPKTAFVIPRCNHLPTLKPPTFCQHVLWIGSSYYDYDPHFTNCLVV